MSIALAIALGWFLAEARVRHERASARAWKRLAKAWKRAAKLEADRADDADQTLDDILVDTQDATTDRATN